MKLESLILCKDGGLKFIRKCQNVVVAPSFYFLCVYIQISIYE